MKNVSNFSSLLLTKIPVVRRHFAIVDAVEIKFLSWFLLICIQKMISVDVVSVISIAES